MTKYCKPLLFALVRNSSSRDQWALARFGRACNPYRLGLYVGKNAHGWTDVGLLGLGQAGRNPWHPEGSNRISLITDSVLLSLLSQPGQQIRPFST